MVLNNSGNSGWNYTIVDGVRNDSATKVPSGYTVILEGLGMGKLFKATSSVTHTFTITAGAFEIGLAHIK